MNYTTLLPIVVSEIWRSYLERTISSAIKNERIKRVEAELELEKYKNQPENPFSQSEVKEFDFIWGTFNKIVELKVFAQYAYNSQTKEYKKKDEYNLDFHLSNIFVLLNDSYAESYNGTGLSGRIYQSIEEIINKNYDQGESVNIQFENFISEHTIKNDLLECGLIEKFSYTMRGDYSEYPEYKFEFSKKYFRFRFWLAYHKKLPNHLQIEIIK